jgi:DNA-binding PadR family transcriptional regulator
MAHAKKESQNENSKSADHEQPASSHVAAVAGNSQNSRERLGKRAFLTVRQGTGKSPADSGKTLLSVALDGVTVVHRYTDYRSPMPKRKLDPLPSAAFQILLSLAGEELHGYGIMRQVAEQTGDRMRLGPGTLYSSIQSLLEEKFIEEVDTHEDAKLGHERRRYYRLTSAGRKLARSEADRLAGWLRVARAKKILRGDYV